MIRTRFAPSPTGYLHIGGARTALFNYLFAKRNGGTFILRIEDTDLERSKIEYEKEIINDLKWLRLEWDEGPDVGGSYGPYRQSERSELYTKELNKLIDKGMVYECYCTEEELEIQRKLQLKEKKPPLYDRRCLKLTDKKKQEYISQGRKPSYRFMIPHKFLEYVDLIHGKMNVDTSLISDPIIVKSNGIPTYNFACVVDDYYMGITHVIRGDEHLDNTPRQILIFEALGYNYPHYAHIPMILAPDRTKLSKRHGATSVRELKDMGFVPEAVINYISLLGWSPKENREIFNIREIIERFDFDHILDHPAVYDIEKMKWFNHYYISNILTSEEIIGYLKLLGIDVNVNIMKYKQIVDFEKSRVYLLHEFAEVFNIINTNFTEYDLSDKSVSEFVNILKTIYDDLSAIDLSSVQAVKDGLKLIQQKHGLKTPDLYKPLRLALTNKLEGVELPKLIYLMEKENLLKKVKNFIDFVDKKSRV
ncbi:MAG: glutamate--tRNA ligase [Candidatus Calescibacterium sp.]|nr:glutamate--tRNA ligase [Candidatus Calescibacterium sp.]MDW8133073.1 glutamate--tRNA ligase [Candidatus Calescibacterium sp.]